MGKSIVTKVHIDEGAIQAKLDEVVNDEAMLEIHNLFAKMMDPYVPFGTDLSNLEVTPEHVRYTAPYAHYHYEGEVYGLNIPIIENGIVVGWFSLPDENGRKHPTGKQLQYTKAKASRHWDEAMMAEKREEFVKQVHDILARRARDNGG